MNFDEDSALIERFLGGDRASFNVLYERYYDKVFGIARGILLNSDEAADAVQEIFTLAYRHLERFDRRARFSTWLFRVAVNRSIQEARKHRHSHRFVELSEELVGSLGSAPVESGPDEGPIHAALTELSEADRAVLTLFYWEDLSLQEIGESLGCGANADRKGVV